jgi:hypothetical protein
MHLCKGKDYNPSLSAPLRVLPLEKGDENNEKNKSIVKISLFQREYPDRGEGLLIIKKHANNKDKRFKQNIR